MMKNLFLVLLVIPFIFYGCSSTPTDKSTIVFDQDVVVTDGENSQDIKKGNNFVLDTRPVSIESRGYKTAYLIPTPKTPGQVNLKLQSFDLEKSEEAKSAVNNLFAKVYERIYRVQSLLLQGDAQNALLEFEKIESEYGTMSYLLIIKAGIYHRLNRKAESISSLEQALSDFPDHEQAKILYKRITGKAYEPQQKSEAITE